MGGLKGKPEEKRAINVLLDELYGVVGENTGLMPGMAAFLPVDPQGGVDVGTRPADGVRLPGASCPPGRKRDLSS